MIALHTGLEVRLAIQVLATVGFDGGNFCSLFGADYNLGWLCTDSPSPVVDLSVHMRCSL